MDTVKPAYNNKFIKKKINKNTRYIIMVFEMKIIFGDFSILHFLECCFLQICGILCTLYISLYYFFQFLLNVSTNLLLKQSL